MTRILTRLAPLALCALAACAVGGQGQSTDSAARRAASSGMSTYQNPGGSPADRADQGADPGVGGAPSNAGSTSGGGN